MNGPAASAAAAATADATAADSASTAASAAASAAAPDLDVPAAAAVNAVSYTYYNGKKSSRGHLLLIFVC